MMKCVICRQGVTRPGSATVTLERGALMLIVRHVPADICEICGEEYIGEEAAREVLAGAERAASQGVQFEVREFAA